MGEDRFEAAYRVGSPPWDIGRPQGAIVRLAEAGGIVGAVLDVGCGTGENALHLAALGRPVLGIDRSPTAISAARAKAAERGIAASFRVADALDLRRLQLRVETVIDVGFFHTLEDEQRRAYAHSLCEVLSPGGVLHVLCFSEEEPVGPGPRRVAEHEIRAAFRSLFAVIRCSPDAFEANRPEGDARAWLATLNRI